MYLCIWNSTIFLSLGQETQTPGWHNYWTLDAPISEFSSKSFLLTLLFWVLTHMLCIWYTAPCSWKQFSYSTKDFLKCYCIIQQLYTLFKKYRKGQLALICFSNAKPIYSNIVLWSIGFFFLLGIRHDITFQWHKLKTKSHYLTNFQQFANTKCYWVH